MRVGLTLALLIAGALPAQKKDLYDQTTLRSLYVTFTSGTWYKDLEANRATGKYLQGNLVVDGQLYQQIGVRIVGNNSFSGTTSQKKSLAISMDAFIANQELFGYDALNLHNGFNDPTLLREVIGYEILRKYVPAPKANWVKVFINNVYWGLYANIQQIDKKMIRPWFKGNDGNRYLADAPTSAGKGNEALQWLGANLQGYKDAYDLKGDVKVAVKPWEDVRNLCNILNNSTKLTAELPKVLDVDRSLWFLAYYNLAANLNSYNSRGRDYYLYHDEQHDVIAMLPWDMAGAFGASSGQSVKQATDLNPFSNQSKRSKPLLGKLWGIPEWRSRYIHHMKTMLDESFTWAKVSPLVTKHAKFIDAAVKSDAKKLYSYQNFLDNVTKQIAINTGNHAKTVPGLKQLCDDREKFLRALTEFKAVAPVVSSLVPKPVDPKPNTPVVVTAKVTNTVGMGQVTLYYRSESGYTATQMFDDGKHGDGAANDGVFGATVPSAVHKPGAVVQFYVGAQSAAGAGGATSYEPKLGANVAPTYVTRWAVGQSPITVNELLAINVNGKKDPNGENDDWAELYNSSNKAVTAGGMFLTDNISNPTKFPIPAGTQIPAKGTLLIWCDEDGSQGKLHANFKLNGLGEEVILFDTDGFTRVSSIRFGKQQADTSIGRLTDGVATPLVAYRKFNNFGQGPSPDAPNEPTKSAREYWPLDFAAHNMFIEWVGAPRLGNTNAIRTLGGPSQGLVLMFLGTKFAILPIGGGMNLMIGGSLAGPFLVPTDQSGQGIVVINIPNNAALAGFKLFLQVAGTGSKGFTVSNGAQVTLFK